MEKAGNNDSCFSYTLGGHSPRGEASTEKHGICFLLVALGRGRLLTCLPILQHLQDEVARKTGEAVGFCHHVEVQDHVRQADLAQAMRV